MPVPILPRWRAALRLDTLNDLLRANMLAAIEDMSPHSVLIQIPSIAASVKALVAKGATLAWNVAEVAALRRQLAAAITARDVARRVFDLELDSLKTLVENNAANGAEVTSMGFLLFEPATPSETPPDAPGALVVTIGREHGNARVSVPGAGYQGRFVAEVSPYPVLDWTPLPGTGKSRELSGYPSGTQLWVRFAAVRFGLQGPWGTPALVTLP